MIRSFSSVRLNTTRSTDFIAKVINDLSIKLPERIPIGLSKGITRNWANLFGNNRISAYWTNSRAF